MPLTFVRVWQSIGMVTLACLVMVGFVHTGGRHDILGLVYLFFGLLGFLITHAIVATVSALCAASGTRRRTFWITFGLWPLLCIALAWGPSICEVTYAWIIGASWGSYSGEFPGYLYLLTRYILVNQSTPSPSLFWTIMMSLTIWMIVLVRRFRTAGVAAAGVMLLASAVILLSSVTERSAARRCERFTDHYDYVTGGCTRQPHPYLPLHVRHPVLIGIGALMLGAAPVSLVLGIRSRARNLIRRRDKANVAA
jgi:hypothetical protein